MGSLGPFEIILIFLVILLVFGAKRIPEIARGLGKGIREFKSATTEIKNELTVDTNQMRAPSHTTAPRQDTYQTQPAPQPAQPAADEASKPAESGEAGA